MNSSFPSRLISLAIILIIQTTVCLAQDKLSGSATVSPTGAAVYSVAIEAPKGVGDLMPSIGIAYNSQTGNGLVGYGCNITGLSAITRGTKTIAHDNTVKGISYSNDCALYLDGKRLLLKSGTEGTDGCVYAPEGEPLTSITLHYPLSSTYCWFEVDTNDGMVYEYGHNGGQQFISNPSAIAAWHITKATNPMGQTITYQYNADGLYLYPQTITYGGDNTVNFTYEARTDSIFFALGNCRGYVAQRLKTISTKAGDNTFRTYTMSYNTTSDGSTTKFSRLTTIHETGENGNSNHSLSAIWNYLPNYSESCQQSVVNIPADNNYEQYNNRYLLSGDLNNDGISDIIHVAQVTNPLDSYYRASVYKSQVTNGTVSFQSQIPLDFSSDVHINGSFVQKARSYVVDINGDGRNDLVFPCITNETNNGANALYFDIRFSEDTQFGFSTNYTYGSVFFSGDDMPFYSILDLKGDGRNEIIALERQGSNGQYTLHLLDYAGSNTPAYTINFTLQSAPKRMFTSDFNHDGLTDLMLVSDSGYRIFYNQGGTSLQNLFVNSSTLNNGVTNHERMESGDFNGDGILDFIWNDNYSSLLHFEIGNADGTFTHYQACNLDFNTNPLNSDEGTWNCMVTDLDHDGKSDVVLNLAEYVYNISTSWIYYNTHTYWLLSNGTSLTKKKEATSTRKDDAKAGHLFAGDFKGNGFFEVANYGYDCYNGTNANVDPTLNIYSCSNHNIANGKVGQFQDSNGRKVAFTYSSMTSDSVYTKGTGSSYPVIDIAAPLCVTSQVSEFGGSPIAPQTNYTYKGLRAHLQGRGLLGFSEVTATEINSGKTIKNTVNIINPTYYVPTRTTITTTQGGMTATTLNIMTIQTSSNSSNIPNGNYQLLPQSKVESDIYHNGIVTSYNYDPDYLYLTSETIGDDNGNVMHNYDYTYSQNKIAGAYRPVSILLTQTHCDDSEPFEKLTDYTYDSYGRKTSVTEFSGENLQLTTTYQYDSYGNITKKKYSGYGISNDTETNYQYSSNGKFLTQKSNIAQTISYTRNAFGDVMAETDNTNPSCPLTTTYTRNGFGTLTSETKPTGETTTWTKSSTSEYGGCYCITATSNNAPLVKTWYDALGNEMRTETKGIGEVEISTTNTYNTSGKLTTKTNIHGTLTTTETYTYDNPARLIAITSSDGTSETYAYSDYETIVTRNGQTYTKYRDTWGNVVQADDPVSSVYYYYDAIGKPSEIETEGGIVEIEYDDCGNQISLNDPDAGLTTYQYDALHRVISQTDARGNVTTYSYDGAERITQKTVAGTSTNYTYATSGNGAGRLVSEQTGDRTITYTYDNKGRLSQETRSMTGEQPLTFGYSYNSNGTLATRTYPQGVTIGYVYEGSHCIATKMDSTNICLTTLDNGNMTVRYVGGKLMYGNPRLAPIDHGGIIFNSSGGALPMGGDPYTPQDFGDPIPDFPTDTLPEMPSIIDSDHYFAWNSTLQHRAEYDTRGYLTKLATQKDSLMFSFQSGTGNLLSRTGMTSQTETFTYDAIDRLTQASGSSALSVSYNDDGNIYSKTGPGTYTYSLSHPHAVNNVTNPSGCISSVTQTATYTPFGKVSTLSDNGYTMNFTYGPDEERWKTVLQNNGNTVRTTLYADSYERITEDGRTRHFYYLDGGVIYVLNDGASVGTFYYTFTDHLGSITRIYNKNRVKVFSAEYDAWGKQTVTLDTLSTFGFHRGYTGHEMLPEFGLINMNGRLYDPVLGRFLSPDNYVQMPDFSQSFNRYSYCLNNPLKYKDPDGECFFLSFISGFIRGTVDFIFNHGQWYSPFYDGYKNAINDIKISWGLFKGDTKQVLSRFTWELPQTILGLSWSKTRLVIEDIDKVRYFDGATFVINENSHSNKGVTLGSYININDKGSIPLDDNENFAPQKDPLYMHEYGHYLQSQEYGFGYLVSVGIQSIISATFSKKIDTPPYSTHNNKWFEISANKKAADYFKKKYGVSWKSYEDSYPL